MCEFVRRTGSQSIMLQEATMNAMLEAAMIRFGVMLGKGRLFAAYSPT